MVDLPLQRGGQLFVGVGRARGVVRFGGQPFQRRHVAGGVGGVDGHHQVGAIGAVGLFQGQVGMEAAGQLAVELLERRLLFGGQRRAGGFGRLVIAIAARRGGLFAAEAPASLATDRRLQVVAPVERVLVAAQRGPQVVDLLLQRVETVAERLQPGAQLVLERADGRQPVGQLRLGVDESRPQFGQGRFQFGDALAPVGAGLYYVAVHACLDPIIA